MILSCKQILFIVILSETFSCATSRPCDLGASDLLFVIQSSFDIDKYDFDDVKLLIQAYLEDLNFGDQETSTRVGVILFDRVREPEYRIRLGEIKHIRKLQKAIKSISRLPCGYWWCQIKAEQNVAQAVDVAVKVFANESSPERMKKLVVILNGKQYLPTIREITALSYRDPLLRVAQVLVVPG
uniref:VWFA domain-containing protein n=1 Tax=Syphacia muris TaxID=451379 RepID=A0A0N5AF99_9BILA